MRVGILHSLSGAMAVSESALVDAAQMAIAEINQAGGLLGEPVEAIVRDGASNPDTFARAAEALITQDQAVVLFGCWTSSSRKAVLPVLETHQVLLWYPVQYEGFEAHPQVFYTGACLNQQIEPAIRWLLAQGKRRFYLLGSDYIFPWTAHKLIRVQLDIRGGAVVGEDYLPLDPLAAADFEATLQQIRAVEPDVIFNTLNGVNNLTFYQAFQAAGLTAETLPIMAVSVAEGEVQQIGAATTGHYASWSYFQSLDLPTNQAFVRNFQARYGRDRVTSDPIEAAYFQVYLWKQAVETAGCLAWQPVRQAAVGQTFAAPGGPVTLQPNQHVGKPCRIGQILPSGQFAILHNDDTLILPQPWLGIETANFDNAPVTMALMAEISQWIQKAQDLELALRQLQQETAERQRTAAALRDSQTRLARLQAESQLAQRLQTMLLPDADSLQQLAPLDIAATMQPAEQVGGDYYDVLTQGDRLYIGIGDVTGHGIESGSIMLMVQTAIRTLIAQGETDLTTLLQTVNQVLHANLQQLGTYHTMTLILLSYDRGQLQICGQHESVVVIRANGAVEIVDTFELGFPLGLEPDVRPFLQVTQLTLAPDDLVVVYTDGITEAMNADNQQYGLAALLQTARTYHRQPAQAIRDAILAHVVAHTGTQALEDDITLLVFKGREAASQAQ